MLPIVQVPHPVLLKNAAPVLKVDNKIQKLIEEMKKTLLAQKDPEGVGLAAPQVGHSLQIFIMKPGKKAPISTFINPKIISIDPVPAVKEGKKNKHVAMEGCLSIPKYWAEIGRSQKLTLTYLNEDGQQQTNTFTGFEAVIIQHEMDHLHGVLFTKRALEQNQIIYKEENNEFIPTDISKIS